jgi:hypothetical protein
MAQMIDVAQGKKRPNVTETTGYAQASNFHGNGRVSMAYLPVGTMLDFLGDLVHATAPELEKNSSDMTFGGEKEKDQVIISTTNVSQNAYEVSTFIPKGVIGKLDAGGGALWRIAFQPVLNPPALPPLPVPPPQLLPPSPPSSPSDVDTPHQHGTPPGHPVSQPARPTRPA